MSTHTRSASPPAIGADAARAARAARRDTVVLAGAVGTMGLLAGLFYAFACAVMPGLQAAADRSAVDVMQQINRSIENPVFFATYLGAPALAAWAAVSARRRGSPVVLRWVVAGLALYAVGFIVTRAFNIPLNDRLEAAGDPSRIVDVARVRDDFETPWVIWNLVRTAAVTAAFGCLARALYLRARGER